MFLKTTPQQKLRLDIREKSLSINLKLYTCFLSTAISNLFLDIKQHYTIVSSMIIITQFKGHKVKLTIYIGE